MSNEFAHLTNGAEVIQLDTLNLNSQDFSKFSDAELLHAVELLVSPAELCERQVLVAILNALEFQPQDVKEQLREGVPLNAGPVLNLSDCADFNTTTRRESVA